jgi:hypothetical protein
LRLVDTRMARSAGLEPATSGLLGTCSIQLSYERIGLLALAFGVWTVCNHRLDAPNPPLIRSFECPPLCNEPRLILGWEFAFVSIFRPHHLSGTGSHAALDGGVLGISEEF